MIFYGLDTLSGYRADEPCNKRGNLLTKEIRAHQNAAEPTSRPPRPYIINAWLVIFPDMSCIL